MLDKVIKGWKNDSKDKKGELLPEDKELFDARLSVCRLNKCKRLLAGICTACGCPVRKKTKVLTELCPENMWSPIIYTEGTTGDHFILVSELPPLIREKFLEWLNQDASAEADADSAVSSDDWFSFLGERESGSSPESE